MKQTMRKWTEIGRKGMALLLALVMVLGVCMPVYATGDATEPTEPTTPETTLATEPETVETTAPAEPSAQVETAEPTVESSEPATSETTVPASSETSAPSVGDDAPGTPDKETVPDATVPQQTPPAGDQIVTSPAPDFTAYDRYRIDLAALEEEAKNLEATEEVLDEFYDRFYAILNSAQDDWEKDAITNEEMDAIHALGYEILLYLKDTYGYENGSVVLEATARTDDVVTTNANGAIKFSLFNYDRNINYTNSSKSEKRPISTYFNFRDGNNTGEGMDDPYAFPQTEYDKDGFPKNHATVMPNLVNGFPVLDLYTYADGEKRETNLNETVSQDIRSLKYLFSSGDHAVTEYTPENSILKLENGRYQYDTKTNAVDYDEASNKFYVRNYVERTSSTAGFDGYSDFMPFVHTDGQVIGQTAAGIDYHIGVKYNDTQMPVDYWLGMVMEVEFYMPKDGKVNGEDMKFYFSGDDDVWVFVDDVLVLDLGGTHGTVDGSINFATGEVLQYLSWQGANPTDEDKTGGSTTSFPTTLKKRYTAADKDPNGGWSTDGNTFANYSKHTLKFFYLERGGGTSNCKLDFNLPTLPPGGVSVTKELSEDSQITDATKAETYTFQLLKEVKGEFVPVTNAAYSVDNVSAGQTDGEGKFTISPGKTAVFTGLLTESGGVKYRVKEMPSDNSYLPDGGLVYSGGSSHTTGNDYIEFTIHPNDTDNNISHQAMFTNALKTTDFSVYKKVTGNMGDWNDQFTFNAIMYTKDPADGGTVIDFNKNGWNDGITSFTLRHGETKTFADIPLGAYVVITEQQVGNYKTKWVVDPKDLDDPTNTEAYTNAKFYINEGTTLALTTDLDDNNDMACFLNDYEVTIDTGIAFDSLPYILIIAIVAVGGVVLLLRKRKPQED